MTQCHFIVRSDQFSSIKFSASSCSCVVYILYSMCFPVCVQPVFETFPFLKGLVISILKVAKKSTHNINF